METGNLALDLMLRLGLLVASPYGLAIAGGVAIGALWSLARELRR